ncbi:unnamed protein product [Arctogadus glacialis]
MAHTTRAPAVAPATATAATLHRSTYETTPPPGDQVQLRHGSCACWGSFTPRPSREVCWLRSIPYPRSSSQSLPPPRVERISNRKDVSLN